MADNYSQNINSLYLNWDWVLTKNLSAYISLFYEHTSTRYGDFKNNYTNVLPLFSLKYASKNNLNLILDYSKKITRPSVNFLNPNPIYLNSLYILRGNPYLLPQTRDNVEFTMSKTFQKKTSFSFNLYGNRYENLISEVYTSENDIVITEYANIGQAYDVGVSVGLATPLAKNVSVNVNLGAEKSSYSSILNDGKMIQNSGFSFMSNVNLSATFNDKWYVNFGFNYRSHTYSLISTQHSMPYMYCSVERNFFKDKLTIRASYDDMFSLYSRSWSRSNNPIFSQDVNMVNNMSNAYITVLYRFGKSFNNRIRSRNIDNSDIIIK